MQEEAGKGRASRVPQQWLARASSPGVDPSDHRRLDFVAYGASPLGEALCCEVTLVSDLMRKGRAQPSAATQDGAMLAVAERRMWVPVRGASASDSTNGTAAAGGNRLPARVGEEFAQGGLQPASTTFCAGGQLDEECCKGSLRCNSQDAAPSHDPSPPGSSPETGRHFFFAPFCTCPILSSGSSRLTAALRAARPRECPPRRWRRPAGPATPGAIARAPAWLRAPRGPSTFGLALDLRLPGPTGPALEREPIFAAQTRASKRTKVGALGAHLPPASMRRARPSSG